MSTPQKLPQKRQLEWKLPVSIMGVGVLIFVCLFGLLVAVAKKGPSLSAPGWQGVGNFFVDSAIVSIILPLFFIPATIFAIGLIIGIVRGIKYFRSNKKDAIRIAPYMNRSRMLSNRKTMPVSAQYSYPASRLHRLSDYQPLLAYSMSGRSLFY